MRLLVLIGILFTSACANQGLQQVSSTSRGPDEFIVEPKKELEQPPASVTQLPTPTPGQGNRADLDPKADLVVALGGRPSDANAPVPASDAALVRAASRNGVTPNVRKTLAQEDENFRSGKSRFTQFRLFPNNLYLDVYSSQSLDARQTADAWRRAGARTSSYPPRQ